MKLTKKEWLLEVIGNSVLMTMTLMMIGFLAYVKELSFAKHWVLMLLLVFEIVMLTYWFVRRNTASRREYEVASAVEPAGLHAILSLSMFVAKKPFYGAALLGLAIAWAIRAARKYQEEYGRTE